jgi:hypothetical protein
MKKNLLRLCLALILALIGYTLVTAMATATRLDTQADTPSGHRRPLTGTEMHASNAISYSWLISDVDAVDFGYYIHPSYTSIAVDSADNVHISYRGPDGDLRYATLGNSDWLTQVVYDAAINVARENAIAVDSNDHPHVSFSFRDGGNEDLVYARNVTGTWLLNTVDYTGSVGMENDIALDSADNVHISHWQWSGNKLRYSTNASGTWATDVISDDTGWDRTAIALDRDDKVHFAYMNADNLVYATNLSGTWELTVVVTNVHAYHTADIALDSQDKAHVSYSSGDALLYATNASGVWQTDTIASNVSPGRFHAIAVDQDGKVHVSYYDSVQGDLEYANNVAGFWVTDTVDSIKNVGLANSIAIDGKNLAHISYRYDVAIASRLYGVWGSPSADVFAVGLGGAILRYADGSWDEMNSGTQAYLYGVWGSASSDVFAVGGNGTILHYDGDVWSEMDSQTAATLYGVWGSSASDVFAVGNGGTILHYDGGAWEGMNAHTTVALRDVWGVSSTNVLAVGDGGTILHYDGGAWDVMTSGITSGLNSVWGSSFSDVFAVGGSGKILHFDGGAWSEMDSGSTAALQSVWGSSASDVFAAGSAGTILHYDGGAWSEMDSGTGLPLFGVWSNAPSNALAVGGIVNGSGTFLLYDGSVWRSWSDVLSPTLRHAAMTDTRSPTSAITTPVSGQIITAAQYTVAGLANDDLSGIGGVQVSTGSAATWGQAITSGQSSRTKAWHYLWNIPDQDNVTHTLRSRAWDRAGNEDNTPNVVTVTVDNVRPTSFISAPYPGQTLVCSTCVIRGSAVDGSGILTVEVSSDEKASWQPATLMPNGSFTTTGWVYTWTVLHNGTFTFYARATDGAYNVEVNGPSVTFSVKPGGYVVYLPIICK